MNPQLPVPEIDNNVTVPARIPLRVALLAGVARDGADGALSGDVNSILLAGIICLRATSQTRQRMLIRGAKVRLNQDVRDWAEGNFKF